MFPTYKTLVIIMLVALAPGCISTVSLKSPLRQPPLIEKSLKPVVILYSANLQNHKCIIDKGYIAESWTIALGPPSMEMFNLIFEGIFDNPQVVGTNIDALAFVEPKNLIEVSLLRFDGCEARWPIVESKIEVAYEAILRNANGGTIARWVGRGQAGPDEISENYTATDPSIAVEARYLSDVTGIAMRKAAADFVINFDKDAKIRDWLRK